ncbi:MAG: ORF6N domain-containing protein, partial [Candidatus Saccharibacteria bacterium]|nr:ORF6N domain-containing protein [Candidatus Saccharibacteria bacterium]
MNEIIKEETKVEDMIFEIRGMQVMLASDVSRLYDTETKRVNEVIKRNQRRSPKEFCFQLTKKETEELLLRSQFATLDGKRSSDIHGFQRYLPYVLTEQGIMMLSGLLKSDVAVEMNIKIIQAFVVMRKYMNSALLEDRYFYNQVMKNTEDIKLLQDSFA